MFAQTSPGGELSHWLTPADVAEGDITSFPMGQSLIARYGGHSRGATPLRAYRFGDTSIVVSESTRIRVRETSNQTGRSSYEVFPIAQGATLSGPAGFVVPPNSSFKYNNDGQFTSLAGTWIRKIWWQIQFADNYSCTGCGAYDYWRVYGRIQGSTETGTDSSHGYKRLWLEFDRSSSTSATEFEPIQPVQSYAGQDNVTQTIGFGAGLDFTLGAAPTTASGGIDLSYVGSVSKSVENWHPVVRAESGSGGVQWCYYVNSNFWTGNPNEFTGTRFLTTRASVRHASSAAGPTWNILYGMQDSYADCPTQL